MKSVVQEELVPKLEEFHFMSWELPGTLKLLEVPEERGLSPNSLVPMVGSPSSDGIPFEVLYHLNLLIQKGCICQQNLSPIFYTLLHPTQNSVEITRVALQRLSKSEDQLFGPVSKLQHEIRALSHLKAPRIPRNMVEGDKMWVRRLMVSPTKVYCTGPDLEDFNRVTREFARVAVDFLRVTFVEEDQDTLSSAALSVPAKGGVLAGCLDETGTLNHGEVFVQVTPKPEKRSLLRDGLETFPTDNGMSGIGRIVRGVVVVAKNPCLYPGDVRVLKAINTPALHHMVDCIVFPQKGPRPHPNECSGSDLDGDLYFVTWDPRLVPPRGEDLPMDYSPAPTRELDRPVTIEDMQRFFADHLVNDSVGVIANAHVVHADREPSKARDAKCVELAKLFSTAVDFPKTGVPAIIPWNLRPWEYPDFMEKEDKDTYISTGVLGLLYRSLTEIAGEQQLQESLQRLANQTYPYDKDMEVHGFKVYLSAAC